MVALKTFNNLAAERRQEIIFVCLEEFALNEYQSASLSNIIKKLNLAKGSFYRYFENKQSLYFFLLDHCIQKRIENDKKVIKKPPKDFFELVLQHFRAKIQFDRAYPLPSAFLYNVLLEKNSVELGNIQFVRKQKALGIIEKLVNEFIENGQIRNDVDKNIIAWQVLQTQLSILDFIELHFKLDFRESIKKHKRLYSLPEKDLMKIAKQFVEIQKTGIMMSNKRRKK